MTRVWLLAGPPFGPALFRAALPRLIASRPEATVVALEVVEAAAGGGWQASAEALAARVSAGDVVVAHGLAVPVAIAMDELARERGAPLGAIALLNGPLERLDRVASVVVQLAHLPGAAHTLFHSAPWLAWLRSSAGLRRAVNNPYAMDRDTVAALCGPLVSDASQRVALVAWLRSLRTPWPSASTITAPLTLLWGDNDDLHPLGEADAIGAKRGAGLVRVALGGRFAWPEELPWVLADAVASMFARSAPGTPVEPLSDPAPAPVEASTTPMSRTGKAGGARRRRAPTKSQVGI
ncbi:hypothetical protein LBMAG42_33330 [Deltaproteobacteria bacterium]|nr:hypothetical protein LBMAG42_33330 [Deltaproteobacteria bacterium]